MALDFFYFTSKVPLVFFQIIKRVMCMTTAVAGQSRTASNSSGNGRQKRRLQDFFHQNKGGIDYRDGDTLRKFLSPEGKILPSRRTGLTSKNQRKLTRAIKRARLVALIPFVNPDG